MLVFEEGGKPENPEKNSQSKGENEQQTQPTYDAGSGNRTRDTLVGGERSHHCTPPPPPPPPPPLPLSLYPKKHIKKKKKKKKKY